MTLRRLLFWIHLGIGLGIGLVVVFLAITGSVLAFQTQIIQLAERRFQIVNVTPAGSCIAPSELLARAAADHHGTPGSLVLYADPHRPAEVAFERDTVLLNACTGKVLSRDAGHLRALFSDVKDLHRWVAWGGVRHEGLRKIKDIGNLCFFVLLVSGVYLWIPRKLDWRHFRAVLWLRNGLSGRAKDWNLHNVIGFWMVLPLAVIVLTGVIMAYPWANGLLYRAAGETLPTKPDSDRGGQKTALPAREYRELDPLIDRAEAQDPQWSSMAMRMPAEKDKTLVFSIEEGEGGRPQQRAQLSLSRKDASVQRWEPFSTNTRGRRWRIYARFLHTGEVFGWLGQLVALTASLSALVLVWTGAALAVRRFRAWRSRRTVRRREILSV